MNTSKSYMFPFFDPAGNEYKIPKDAPINISIGTPNECDRVTFTFLVNGEEFLRAINHENHQDEPIQPAKLATENHS